MANQFKYDAFISYRHTELDKFVAENLHKQLEAFNLPKGLAKKRKGQKNKIERVFRDKDELPLTSNLEDPILQALHSSEWLIVICSPRLRESMWCRKEIETFVSLRGREHVLAVLIEGEPSESFPDELLYRIEEVKQPDGTVEQVKIPVEPLAADVRGETRKDVLKAMKTEIMRILAAMFQVDYDDLRQRHRERRMRRIVGASLLVGTACLLFGVYSTLTALQIKKQSTQIETQSTQILAQSEEILEQNEQLKQKSEEIQKQNEEIQKQNEEIQKQNEELALRQARALAEEAERYLNEGDRDSAIQTAVEALTVSDGIQMPYTAYAQYVLTDALRAYDTGDVYAAQYQYGTVGRIDVIKRSPDTDTLAIFDDTSIITLYDFEKQEVIEVIGADEFYSWGGYGFSFLGDDRFVYVNLDNKLSVYDLAERKVFATIGDEHISEVIIDDSGRYILTKGFGEEITIYDGTSYEKLGKTQKMNMGSAGSGPYVFADGMGAECYVQKSDDGTETYYLYFYDFNTGEIISICNLGNKLVTDLEMRGGVAYVLTAAYTEGYADCDTYIMAISVDTGEILWENVELGQFPRLVKLPGTEDASELLFCTNFSVQLMQMQTGEITHITMMEKGVVEAYAYNNSNNFLLFVEDGSMLVLSKEHNLCVDLSDRFDCKTDFNGNVVYSKYGIAVAGLHDNRVTFYVTKLGAGVTEDAEQKELPATEDVIRGEQATELVMNYGLDNAQYVYHLYYSDDGKVCFIRYWDGRLLIYDVEEGKVINVIEDAYSTSWYLGKDAENCTYLLGFAGCYVLNEDMEPVTWIPHCKDVDLQNRKVNIRYNTYSCEAPIYTLEELLQIAKDEGYSVE